MIVRSDSEVAKKRKKVFRNACNQIIMLDLPNEQDLCFMIFFFLSFYFSLFFSRFIFLIFILSHFLWFTICVCVESKQCSTKHEQFVYNYIMRVLDFVLAFVSQFIRFGYFVRMKNKHKLKIIFQNHVIPLIQSVAGVSANANVIATSLWFTFTRKYVSHLDQNLV